MIIIIIIKVKINKVIVSISIVNTFIQMTCSVVRETYLALKTYVSPHFSFRSAYDRIRDSIFFFFILHLVSCTPSYFFCGGVWRGLGEGMGVGGPSHASSYGQGQLFMVASLQNSYFFRERNISKVKVKVMV